MQEYKEWKSQLNSWYKRPDNKNRKIYSFYNNNKEFCELDNDYYLFCFKLDENYFRLIFIVKDII